MKLATVLACSLLVSLSGACSSSSSDNSNTGNNGAAPQAPMIQKITPMAGGLHIEWMKHSDCETIEGERKTATEEYKVAFTESCATDNKHDASATGDVEYTYRLRAKNKAGYSAYSDEVSANPTK